MKLPRFGGHPTEQRETRRRGWSRGASRFTSRVGRPTDHRGSGAPAQGFVADGAGAAPTRSGDVAPRLANVLRLLVELYDQTDVDSFGVGIC